MANEVEFKLSDPGLSYSQSDSNLMEYLNSYGFPYPPSVRYGNLSFEATHSPHRVKLFGQVWKPSSVKGTVLLVHGFAEHVGNYGNLINDFVKQGFAVAAIDNRGHGLSEGIRGFVESPDCYAQDIEEWLSYCFPHIAPNKPLYLWGHSLGGLICLHLLVRGNLPIAPSGVALSSPLLGFPRLSGVRKLMMRFSSFMGRVFPTLQLNSGIPDTALSSDKRYLDRRAQDGLIHHSVTPAWVVNVSKTINEVQHGGTDFDDICPILLMLAGKEHVTNLVDARDFAFRNLSSLIHKVIEFPDALHELEKDSVRPRVLSESLAWFESNH